MPLLTDEEQGIYDAHSKTLPLASTDLFEMFIIGINGYEGQFELDDWLVLQQLRERLIWQRDKIMWDGIERTAKGLDLNDVNQFAQAVVLMHQEQEEALTAFYTECLEQLKEQLSFAAIERMNHEMRVPDIEQGSKSDVDWDGVLVKAPSIIYKMYRPAFDCLDKQSWQYRED